MGGASVCPPHLSPLYLPSLAVCGSLAKWVPTVPGDERPLSNSSLASVAWEDAATAYPIFRIYSADSVNGGEVTAFGPLYNASAAAGAQEQVMGQGRATDVAWPLAAAAFLSTNTTTETEASVHVFYQQKAVSGGGGGGVRIAELVANSSLAVVDHETWIEAGDLGI